MTVLNETYTLSNGVTIPKLGFGTWQTPNDVAPAAVKMALKAGYTHIDTASIYRNEPGVAQGLRDAGVDREQVFITTKVRADYKTFDEATASIATSLKDCDTSYFDLILIHAPRPWQQMFATDPPRYFAENVEVWRALEEAYEQGLAKSIGVSNFAVDDLTNVMDHCRIVPMANQINYHIGHTQDAVTAFCQANDILVEAYSPIATGRLLGNPDIQAVANKYGVSIAQICIRYALQKDTLPLPKSTHEQYIIENTQVDFEITGADMATLDALDLGR